MTKVKTNLIATILLWAIACIGIYVENIPPVHDPMTTVTIALVVAAVQTLRCAWIYITDSK